MLVYQRVIYPCKPSKPRNADNSFAVQIKAAMAMGKPLGKRGEYPLRLKLVDGLEHDFYFPIYWEESSQLTNIFKRRWEDHSQKDGI